MPDLTQSKKDFFKRALLEWHISISRPMPWKGVKDPYIIWVSEIMLQQTRVEQAKGHFLRFIDRFPTVHTLAEATETEVLKYWEGLGYYRRARYLHEAANSIVTDHNGIFPDQYEDIISLKGIGKYTAAAIASFAYDKPYPVVDGNVERIISRFMGMEEDINQYKTRQKINRYAQALLDEEDPASYNQAIMDFGALQCTPLKPACDRCPLSPNCVAFHRGMVEQIPKKAKAKKRKKRYFHYFLVENQGKYLFTKRVAMDVWNGMFELPLIELAKPEELALEKASQGLSYINFNSIEFLEQRMQILSHQEINMYFYNVAGATEAALSGSMIWETPENAIKHLPMPKTIGCFLRDKSLHLKNN